MEHIEPVDELSVILSIFGILITIVIIIIVFWVEKKVASVSRRIIEEKDNNEKKEKERLGRDISATIKNIQLCSDGMKDSAELWEVTTDGHNKRFHETMMLYYHEEILNDIKKLQGADFLSSAILHQNLKNYLKELNNYCDPPIFDKFLQKVILPKVIRVDEKIKETKKYVDSFFFSQ